MELPQNISPDLADFLSLCFRKNPADRPSAGDLLDHNWLNQMSNESKIAKIMNLKLPKEVHNTIRVHLRKNHDPEMVIQSPTQVIEQESSAIKNIVKV